MPPFTGKQFTYDSPIGRIAFWYEDSPFVLIRAQFTVENDTGEMKPVNGGPNPSAAGPLLEWLDSYFEKHPAPTPWKLLKMDGFTPLQRAVWGAAAEIDFGSLGTYGDLARAIGRPRAARFVGNALGKNPFPVLIPCHRIIRSDGGLGGFTGGISIKKNLMAFENSRSHPMLAHRKQMW